MKKKILFVIAIAVIVISFLVGRVFAAGNALTGTGAPINIPASQVNNVNNLPGVISHGQVAGAIILPQSEPGTKGNVITASTAEIKSLPKILRGLSIDAAGSGSNHFVGINLFSFKFN